ncbi:membrane protein insertion efficiency factor YidD [Candidatus Poribacteria bacterium]|nr:membrane protein insertion efficiency factor YidD [Candidatus Poribacteria bacterium]
MPVQVALGAIRAYQLLLSPVLGSSCRFQPSCSQYASEAIRVHGLAAGVRLAARRIARCHPWHPGGYDPVPGDIDSRRSQSRGRQAPVRQTMK